MNAVSFLRIQSLTSDEPSEHSVASSFAWHKLSIGTTFQSDSVDIEFRRVVESWKGGQNLMFFLWTNSIYPSYYIQQRRFLLTSSYKSYLWDPNPQGVVLDFTKVKWLILMCMLGKLIQVYVRDVFWIPTSKEEFEMN